MKTAFEMPTSGIVIATCLIELLSPDQIRAYGFLQKSIILGELFSLNGSP
jgi:hypothetical protein